jgi:hypothetical protein
MEIRNNHLYEMGATIVNVDTENMGIVFTTSAKSDEDIEQACKEAVSRSLARGISDAVEAGKVDPIEGMLFGLSRVKDEYESAEVSVVKPSIKSMKAFVEAVYKVTTSGKMDGIDAYEKDVCPLPKEVKDYIKELISK